MGFAFLGRTLGLGLRRGLFVLMNRGFAVDRLRRLELSLALATCFFHTATVSRAAGFAPTPADFGHMSAIRTHRDPPFSTGCASFVAGEFVGAPTFVRSFSPLARDLALTLRIHTSKAALLGCRVRLIARHDITPSESDCW